MIEVPSGTSLLMCGAAIATYQLVESTHSIRAKRMVPRTPNLLVIALCVLAGGSALGDGYTAMTQNRIVDAALDFTATVVILIAAYREWTSGKPPRKRRHRIRAAIRRLASGRLVPVAQ